MKFAPITIRAQMLTAIGALVLLAVTLVVTATLSVAHRQLYELAERDLRDQVESIAARARFAAIVGVDSPEVAKQLLQESTSTNSIEAAELVSDNGSRISELESPSQTLSVCQFPFSAQETEPKTRLTRVGSHWCVTSPIREHIEGRVCRAVHCIIGHLHVVASTQAVDAIVRRLLETILVLGGALLLVSLAVLWHVSARISRPLRDIAAVMRRVAAGDRAVRATENGTEEMVTISRVCNDLLTAQEIKKLRWIVQGWLRVAALLGPPDRFTQILLSSPSRPCERYLKSEI